MKTSTTHHGGTAADRLWRIAIASSGVLFLAGGLTHPAADDSLPVRESLIDELADPAWFVSHALLLAGAMLLFGGVLLMRRDIPLHQTLGVSWPVAVVATGLFAVESVPHLIAHRDPAALRAGDATPLVDLYLLLGVTVYPVMGVALAWLAWRIGRTGRLHHKFVAALGVFGSLVYGAAAPLTALPQTGALGLLFPVGAIPRAWWLVLLGVIGAEVRGPRARRESDRHVHHGVDRSGD